MTQGASDIRSISLGASGSKIEVLAGPAETGGIVSIYRWHMAPSSTGPSPHFHRTFAETFLIEEGEVEYYDAGVWRSLRRGDLAHAAQGATHGLRKVNDQPATILMILTPGVPREEYFAQIAIADRRDVARLHEIHDNHFVDDDSLNGKDS
ncbi:quercetin dioxygenase-like cupin family protein [Nocardioides daedukensis]|uniref:Quercetin dioxygenase-like cupin family protein n=1 Tax=Nocardioides daedukensis TaxID=634462 RepID=A0A7Y9S792_9ACTN|nr:cupin domain-containing protein [Nocardioides daedukensis]NYG60710.1 quercetin dioxygenase-like cupin family protein [Nocardioides daedukensis]